MLAALYQVALCPFRPLYREALHQSFKLQPSKWVFQPLPLAV